VPFLHRNATSGPSRRWRASTRLQHHTGHNMRRIIRDVTFLSGLLLAAPLDAQTRAGMGFTTRFVQVEPGVRLEVLDFGGSGRPVVITAGYGRTAHDFEAFGATLAAQNRVVAVTRRGFGTSSVPATGYSADRLADDLLAVADSLSIVKPVVIGHSLGGQELSSLGSRHPGKVAGLVYLDAAYGYAFYDEASVEDRERIDRNEVSNGIRQLTEALEKGNAEEAHRLIARLQSTDLPALQATLLNMQARIPRRSSVPPQGFAMKLRDGVDRMVFEGLQRFTAVNAPVLAIFALKGTRDTTAINDWNAGRRHEIIALKRAAPQARVLILPTASHDVFRSNEPDVIRETQAFMTTLPPAVS
jgi:non-heme chloroperoxidase